MVYAFDLRSNSERSVGPSPTPSTFDKLVVSDTANLHVLVDDLWSAGEEVVSRKANLLG